MENVFFQRLSAWKNYNKTNFNLMIREKIWTFAAQKVKRVRIALVIYLSILLQVLVLRRPNTRKLFNLQK